MHATQRGRSPCEITWGEMFAVLPFGNSTVILTLTGDQLKAGVPQRVQARVRPNFAGGTGRFPQVSGLRYLPLQRHDAGRGRHVEDARRHRRPRRRSARRDTVRFVTNDFMYTGGDGYTIFSRAPK